MIFRGGALSPFDAPAPLRNGEMIFRGVAISSFDAPAPLRNGEMIFRGAAPLGEPIPVYDHLLVQPAGPLGEVVRSPAAADRPRVSRGEIGKSPGWNASEIDSENIH